MLCNKNNITLISVNREMPKLAFLKIWYCHFRYVDQIDIADNHNIYSYDYFKFKFKAVPATFTAVPRPLQSTLMAVFPNASKIEHTVNHMTQHLLVFVRQHHSTPFSVRFRVYFLILSPLCRKLCTINNVT